MSKPRINLMIMNEGEPDRPVRSYSLPAATPRILIWLGSILAVVLITGWVLGVWFWQTARHVERVEIKNVLLERTVQKITVLETELVFHRDFTRRVAGLIGVSVPDFADSAAVRIAALSDTIAAVVPPHDSAGHAHEYTDDANIAGVLVTDCAPDPNNRPRGMPLLARISRGFAPHDDNPALKHMGIDLAIREGVPVLVTATGTVTSAGPHEVFGLMIVIDHGNGFKTSYGHNSVILARVGEVVQRGDRIAFSGNTGVSTAPHLHYQITKDDEAVDATGFLGR
jgi:murein DD-endopeptidase MepM/ murein hydrolase activator NlpD